MYLAKAINLILQTDTQIFLICINQVNLTETIDMLQERRHRTKCKILL